MQSTTENITFGNEDLSIDSMAEGRAIAAHGSVTTFDGDQEEWVEYAERLDNYFIANDIDDNIKK